MLAAYEDVVDLVGYMPHWHGEILGPFLDPVTRVALHLDLVLRETQEEIEDLLYETAANWCGRYGIEYDEELWEIEYISICNAN